MDPVLKAAEDRRDELRQELKKIDDFLVMYRTLAGSIPPKTENTSETSEAPTDIENPVDSARMPEEREAEGVDATLPRRVRVRDNPKPAAVVAATIDVIRQRNLPMTRRQIWDALKERGVVVNGSDPVKTLGTILWRSGSDHLMQIDGWGYWPKILPVPARPDPANITLDELFG